jgi:hypothetical protein
MKKIKYTVVTGAKSVRNQEVIAEAFDFGVLPEGYNMPPAYAQAGVYDQVWQPHRIAQVYLGEAAQHIGSVPDAMFKWRHKVVSLLDRPTYVLGRSFSWSGDDYPDSRERQENFFSPVGLECNFLPPPVNNLTFLVDRETFEANPDRMDLVVEGPVVQTDLFTDGVAVEWLVGRVAGSHSMLYGVWNKAEKIGRSDITIKVAIQ